jgi:hypothetical protein
MELKAPGSYELLNSLAPAIALFQKTDIVLDILDLCVGRYAHKRLGIGNRCRERDGKRDCKVAQSAAALRGFFRGPRVRANTIAMQY